jgi:1-acyl-sn-glycerol-3-phosphate acyltransferase
MTAADKTLSYPVPWKLVLGLGPNIAKKTQTSVDAFSAGICAVMNPAPVVTGFEELPASARFVLVANHFQRKGLWILHPAAVLTQAIRQHYGPGDLYSAGDPPVRWMVTANWPRVKIGPWSFASPGDWLLPRVAHALACYPVSFVGSNQGFTARSLRRILREVPRASRPLGIFPEGVAGSAAQLTRPLPGIDRLISHLAKSGLPVQPAGVSENGRLIVRFGRTVSPEELLQSPDPAQLAMDRVGDLL